MTLGRWGAVLGGRQPRCYVRPPSPLSSWQRDSRRRIRANLDEFVFRHNRCGNRQAGFQTLLGLGTSDAPVPLAVLRGATDLPQFPIRPAQ